MNPDPFASLNANFSQDRLNQFMQMQNAMQKQQSQPTPQTTQPQPKKRNFWLDQLSTGMSIAGGIGGSFIAPVAGTAAGAGLGGALGEAIENIIDPQGGNWGNVAKEGALSSVMGAGPIKLLKGGAALATGKGLQGASQAATTSYLKKGANTVGQRLTKSGSGLKVGTNVGDVNELDEIAKAFRKHKIVGTPETQLRKIDSTMSKLSGEVDSMLAKKPVPINGVSTRIQQMVDDPMQLTDISLSDKGRQLLQSYINTSSKFTDARQLNKLVSDVNPIARRAYNKSLAGTGLTSKEEAAWAFKQAADDVLQEIAPAVRNTKKEMALLFKYNPQVAKFTEQGLNVPFAGKLTKGLGQYVHGAESVAGSRLAKGATGVGNRGVAGKLGIAGRLGASGAYSSLDSPGGLEGALLESTMSPTNPMAANTNTPTSMNTMIPANSSNIIGQQYQTGQQMSSGSPYSRENLMSDLQRDPQNADKYLAYYQQLQEVFAPAQDTDLSQSSKNAMASSDNAINTVSQLESLFAGAGSGSGRVGGFVKGLAADAGFDEKAKVYNSLASASVTQIAKALAGSGAGTVSDMDAKVIMDALPTLMDTPYEAQAKFAALKQRLENARNNTMLYGAGGETSQPSLEDAIIQSQMQYTQ